MHRLGCPPRTVLWGLIGSVLLLVAGLTQRSGDKAVALDPPRAVAEGT